MPRTSGPPSNSDGHDNRYLSDMTLWNRHFDAVASRNYHLVRVSGSDGPSRAIDTGSSNANNYICLVEPIKEDGSPCDGASHMHDRDGVTERPYNTLYDRGAYAFRPLDLHIKGGGTGGIGGTFGGKGTGTPGGTGSSGSSGGTGSKSSPPSGFSHMK